LPLELVWQAPEGCPDATFVRDRIEQIPRNQPAELINVAAHAKIHRTAEGLFQLALTVRTGDVDESRTIAAKSCSALAEAVAVVVALAIDESKHFPRSHEGPLIDEAPAGEQPSTGREERPPHVSPPTRETPTMPARPPAPRMAFGVGGSLTSGLLPEVSAGIVGSLTVRLGRFRVGVLGTLSFRQSPRFKGNAGASFHMVELGAFGGYMLPLGPVALGPCLNVEATYVTLRGFGIREPQTSSRVWPTIVLGARAEARLLPWLGIFGRADLLFPLGAPTFDLTTSRDVLRLHEPPIIAPRLSLGTEIVFP
jgi:hypothetical protein